MRLAAARPDRQRTTLPGAMLTAVLWHLVQQVGAIYVTHVLAGADAVNQTFGLVLGLMAAIFLVSSPACSASSSTSCSTGTCGRGLCSRRSPTRSGSPRPTAAPTAGTPPPSATRASRRSPSTSETTRTQAGLLSPGLPRGDVGDALADLALGVGDDELVGQAFITRPSAAKSSAGQVEEVVAHAVTCWWALRRAGGTPRRSSRRPPRGRRRWTRSRSDQSGLLHALDGVSDPAAAVGHRVGELSHPQLACGRSERRTRISYSASEMSKPRRRSASSRSSSSVMPIIRARQDRCCDSSSQRALPLRPWSGDPLENDRHPCPPPTHMVTRPVDLSCQSREFSMVAWSRAPVIPKG